MLALAVEASEGDALPDASERDTTAKYFPELHGDGAGGSPRGERRSRGVGRRLRAPGLGRVGGGTGGDNMADLRAPITTPAFWLSRVHLGDSRACISCRLFFRISLQKMVRSLE